MIWVIEMTSCEEITQIRAFIIIGGNWIRFSKFYINTIADIVENAKGIASAVGIEYYDKSNRVGRLVSEELEVYTIFIDSFIVCSRLQLAMRRLVARLMACIQAVVLLVHAIPKMLRKGAARRRHDAHGCLL